jgi:PAS domain-containing protein
MMWQAATILLSTAIVALVVWDWWQRGKLNRRIAELTATPSSGSKLRQLEEHAKAERQTLFNSMGEGVILLDRNGRIQLVNQSLERQFVCPSMCAVKRSWRRFVCQSWRRSWRNCRRSAC